MLRKDAGGRQYLQCPFELKELSEEGMFRGYGSIFGNEDLGGDVIVGPTPFKEFVYTKDKKIRLLYQHDTTIPVGKSPVEQNEKGLYMPEAQLQMDIKVVPDLVYPAMKAQILDGLSIGYDILKMGAEYDEETRTRKLLKLKLWEVSIVTFGMNPKARIERVKAANNITSLREFEEFLRENGFAKEFAVRLAKHGWHEESDAGRRESGSAVKDTIKRIGEFDVAGRRDSAGTVQDLIKLVEGIEVK